MNRFLQRLPLILLLLVQPLAVAGQNIGAGVISAMLLVQLYLRRRELPLAELWRTFKVPMVATVVYLGVLAVSTVLNPANPARYHFNAVGGHLYWTLLPPVIFLAQPRLDERDWRWVTWAGVAMTTILGLFALSQAVWGWHLVGSHFEPGPTRAQGLYSHPLSFAYACMLLFPLGVLAVRTYPRRWEGWAVTVAMGIAIFASRSRTVEVVAAVVVLVNLWKATSGRRRIAGLAALALLAAALLLTKNPLSDKFYGTIEGKDVRSGYPVDDRVAFWRANFDMFLERPVIGHGENLTGAYRVPYYDAIGLQDFERKYEAHDMYLQLAVNGGLIGLAVAMTWFVWQFLFARRLARAGRFAGSLAWQSLWAFAAAAVTQNAFQDAVPRFTLTVLVALLWLAGAGLSDSEAPPRRP